MRSLRWVRNLLAGHETDPIPGWLIWPAVTLSLLALAYGVKANWADFLLNVAASVALLGPGLFITDRVIRNWRHRKLRPLAADTPRYLAVILRRLGKDVTRGICYSTG